MKIKLFIKETKGEKIYNWIFPIFFLGLSIIIFTKDTDIKSIIAGSILLFISVLLGYAVLRKKEFIEQTIECEKYEVLKDEK